MDDKPSWMTEAAPPPVQKPLPPMTDQQKKVYEVLDRLGATSPDRGKTADDIMKAGKFPKGQMLAWIQEMEKKNIIKRVPRDKAAWYYVVKS